MNRKNNNYNPLVKTLHDVEISVKDLNYESGYIINRNGDIIHISDGQKHRVSPPNELVKDNIFTHNHPSGTCAFSLDDVKSIINMNGYEVRVVTADERFVSLTRGESGWSFSRADEMAKAGLGKSQLFIKADGIAASKYGRRNYNKKQVSTIMENLVNDWLRINASNHGAIFTEGKYDMD